MSPVGIETTWPRKDNVYKHKQSLNYQDLESRVWLHREPGRWETHIEYAAYIVLGLMIGLTAFVMDILEEFLIHFKDKFT
jgi:hypothetical protein